MDLPNRWYRLFFMWWFDFRYDLIPHKVFLTNVIIIKDFDTVFWSVWRWYCRFKIRLLVEPILKDSLGTFRTFEIRPDKAYYRTKSGFSRIEEIENGWKNYLWHFRLTFFKTLALILPLKATTTSFSGASLPTTHLTLKHLVEWHCMACIIALS